jgi:hypothetical protein
MFNKKENNLSKLVIPFLIFIFIISFNFAYSSELISNIKSNYNAGNKLFDSYVNRDSIPFAPPVNYPAGDHPESIFCADLDMDGDLDMVVANNFGYDVSILINNSNGTFEAPVNYPAGDNPFSVYCADLDGDDDIDIAVASYYEIAVLLNNGDGTFEGPDIYGEGANHFYFICCADLDGDSYPELVAADPHGFNGVFILINNGDGTFVYDYNNYWVGGIWPWSVSCSDLDGDDDLDMAVANHSSNDVSIFINNGDGTFADAVSYTTGANSRFVYTIDFDNDLDIDVAVANMGSDDVSILMNNGDGTFGSAVNYGTADGPVSIFCSDLDSDNDIDLAVANCTSNNVSILTNNGDGTFDNAVYYTTGNGAQSVFGGDLDADEDIDLTVANWGGDNVSVLFNLTQNPDNQPPEPFSLISPIDGSTVAQQVIFDWEDAIDPNPGDQVTYNLYISTSIEFHPDSTIINSDLQTSQYLETLNSGIYYWKVKAMDNWGAETWSNQTWSFSVTSVSVEEAFTNMPLFVSQNYPNPFSQFTTISFNFSRKDTDDAKIEIYSIKGQKIRTFNCHPELVEGQSSITWDGNDENGKRVTSGIYFYTLKSNNFILETRKMILLRMK